MVSKKIIIQGHRGARGLYPENTLRGFFEAVKLGVDTIELDVVISADKKAVVSHEAWMNEHTCSLPDGNPIKNGTGKNYNLYKTDYAQIKTFDCGKRGNPEFPSQTAISSYKPLLNEVITGVERFTEENALAPVSYNIELKTEGEDGLFNPPPEVFSEIVVSEINKFEFGKRFNLQSFDVRLLEVMKKKISTTEFGLLVENEGGLSENIKKLNFLPDTYSPEFTLVNKELVAGVHGLGMKLIPWTVNEIKDMIDLIDLGVDGLITDYPDRLINLIRQTR
jgi:glycerophosphoryl diester phosphodiesterase